ncbi:MAG: insulinase family protein, partial [Halanaerobiales bacterium]
MEFDHYRTDNNIDIHICNTKKFKTILMEFFLVRPLGEKEKTTRTAVLPFLLFRGSANYPTNQKIIRKLETLYGASLNISVMKRGENQLLRFSLELTENKYLKDSKDLLQAGLEFLFQLIFNPLLENNRFKDEYLKLAKKYIREEIKGIKNDKYNYAIYRCYQEMCSNERFSQHKLGAIDCLDEINSHDLYKFYRQIINESPMCLFLIANCSPEKT